jgi:hypothetical protein
MPTNRFVIVLLALFALFAFVVLQRIPASAQQPAGITLTPTESEQTATPTEVVETPTATEPVDTASPTPTEGITIPPPGDTSTPTPTDELTIPPPGDTSTPIPEEPRDRATRTPPVLPSTGQSPIGGGFPIEGLFAILLLALVGWFFLRGVLSARTQK